MYKIRGVKARQVLDSRGNPTIEADVWAGDIFALAMVPSGASTGKHEALELRDGGKKFGGKGVQKAIDNVNKKIAKVLIGMDVRKQEDIDRAMLELDSTKNKSKLGANAILGVSLACARAAADLQGMNLYEYIGSLVGNDNFTLPVPFMNIINGGLHADNGLDFQEYMIVPMGKTLHESLRMATETYHELKNVLKKRGFSTGVGDEGGFAPNMKYYSEPLDLIMTAINNLGYGKKIKLAMDVAASDFYKKGKYVVNGKSYSADEMIDIYSGLVKSYPIISIEDPFQEDDFKSFVDFTKKQGKKIRIVGDDLLVTNIERLKKGITLNACNTLLLKVNQIGTLSEALRAANMAKKNNWDIMVSHRSGETEDSFIADLAVGLGCGMIKAGAPCRGERTAKYNQLLRIEDFLGKKAVYSRKLF